MVHVMEESVIVIILSCDRSILQMRKLRLRVFKGLACSHRLGLWPGHCLGQVAIPPAVYLGFSRFPSGLEKCRGGWAAQSSLHPCHWRAVLILPPALPPAPTHPFQAAVPTVHWQRDA